MRGRAVKRVQSLCPIDAGKGTAVVFGLAVLIILCLLGAVASPWYFTSLTSKKVLPGGGHFRLFTYYWWNGYNVHCSTTFRSPNETFGVMPCPYVRENFFHGDFNTPWSHFPSQDVHIIYVACNVLAMAVLVGFVLFLPLSFAGLKHPKQLAYKLPTLVIGVFLVLLNSVAWALYFSTTSRMAVHPEPYFCRMFSGDGVGDVWCNSFAGWNVENSLALFPFTLKHSTLNWGPFVGWICSALATPLLAAYVLVVLFKDWRPLSQYLLRKRTEFDEAEVQRRGPHQASISTIQYHSLGEDSVDTGAYSTHTAG